MNETLTALTRALDDEDHVAWGGDWNQPLTGSLAGFTRAARDAVLDAVATLGLQVPTAALPGAHEGQGGIDHVAVPASWAVLDAGCVRVPRTLSDHHAFRIDVARPPALP